MKPRLYRQERGPDIAPADMHEQACAFIEELFGRKGEAPFLYILAVPGGRVWIECPWENDREKDIHTMLIIEMLKQFKATAYTFVSEAWMAVEKYKPGADMPDPATFVRPGDRPKNERDDVLIVSTESRDGELIYTRYLVTIRPPGLGINYLGPRIDEALGDKRSGRMVGLFGKARAL